MTLIKSVFTIACVAALVPSMPAQAAARDNGEAELIPGHADMRTCLPVRPDDAAKNNTAWAVDFSFLVDVGGEIREAKLTRSSGDKALDRDALKAFQKCTFYPAQLHGHPQISWVTVRYKWKP